MDQPAWLAAAWAEFGVREISGSANNARVLAYFRDVGHDEITRDETPWCAAFVGAMLKRAGLPSTRSLLARSYLRWGKALDEPRVGALAVLSRGSDPYAGHVGFYLASQGRRIFLLSGNHGDAVTVEAFEQERLLGYRWPDEATDGQNSAVAVPTAVDPAPDSQPLFEDALAHVLEMEGGFSDDPYDPGGPTNKGITLKDFASWRGWTVTAATRAEAVRALKDIDAETVAAIYAQRYWRAANCASLPPALAFMHFDAAVNHGVGGATRMLQQALAVAPDGEIGPQTLAAAHGPHPATYVERYADLRRARYRALPHFWRFGRGWLRRVDATEAAALRRLSTTTTHLETAKGKDPMDQDFKFPLPGQVPGEAMAGDVGDTGKWWAHSKTVWGTLITAAATVLPVIGPLFGLNLPAEVITKIGDQALVVIQAAAGLFGTLLTIYGRAQATQRLVRKDVSLRM